MDHARPDGRKLAIAVSRLPATGQAHRRGVIVLDPGGPGGMGTDTPQELAGTRLGPPAADPEFFRNLSTVSIAQDMDVIRRSLGEQKIGCYGMSWGSGLGAAYRSMFDEHVDRMTIESVMPAH